MAGLEIGVSVIDASATSTFQQIAAAERTLEQGADRAAGKYQNLNLSVKRLYNETRTPAEQHNRRMEVLNRLVQSGKIDQDLYGRAVKQSQTAMEGAGRAGTSAFGSQAIGMVRNLAAALGVTGGLAGAVMAVRAEYESLKQVQRDAATAVLSLGEAEERALINLGADTAEEREAFSKRAKAISEKRGVSLRDVMLRASDVLSARGEKTVAEAMDVLEQSIAYAPGDVEAGRAAAGAGLDLSRQAGWTPQQTFGLLSQTGRLARVMDPRKVAENLPIVIGSALQNQATVQQGAALWATLSQGMTDVTGRQSRTAALSFITQLQLALPKIPTLEGRIQYLRERPQLAQQFLGLLKKSKGPRGFEGVEEENIEGRRPRERALATLRGLLTPGSKEAAMYAQFKAEEPTQEEAGRMFERRIKVREADPIQQVAAFGRKMDQTLEALEMTPMSKAAIGVLREKFQPILKQAGLPQIGAKLSELVSDISGGDLAAFEFPIKAKIERLKHPVTRPPMYAPTFGYPVEVGAAPREPTSAEQNQVRILESLLAGIDLIIQQQKTNETKEDAAAATKEQTQALRDNTAALKASAAKPTAPGSLNPRGRDK